MARIKSNKKLDEFLKTEMLFVEEQTGKAVEQMCPHIDMHHKSKGRQWRKVDALG